MTTFEVEAEDFGGSWVITVAGDVDLATAPRLLDVGEDVFAKAELVGLVVELSGVTFIDSTGLGALVQLRNLSQQREISLELRSPAKSVVRAMSLAGLSEVFGLVTDGSGTTP